MTYEEYETETELAIMTRRAHQSEHALELAHKYHSAYHLRVTRELEEAGENLRLARADVATVEALLEQESDALDENLKRARTAEKRLDKARIIAEEERVAADTALAACRSELTTARASIARLLGPC